MTYPLVSVIIPTYNREKFIEKTIGSVLNQDYKNLEVIVVDDASTDNTVSIIEKLAKEDKRIKFLVLPKNSGGPAKPRNEGIKISKGEYIIFLDADDYLLKNSITERTNIFLNDDIDIINSNAWVVNISSTSKKIIDYISGITSCLAIKRRVFDEIGLFNEELTGIDELELIIRYKIKTKKEKIFYFDKPTIIYTKHDYPQISKLSYNEKDLRKFIERESKLKDYLEKYINIKSSKIGVIQKNLIWTYFWLSYRYGLLGDFIKMREYISLIQKLKIEKDIILRILIFILIIESKIKSRNFNIFIDKIIKLFKSIFLKKWRVVKLKNKFPQEYNEAINFLKKL